MQEEPRKYVSKKQERYFKWLDKCVNMPESTPIEMCAKLRKFYGFCHIYSKNLKETLEKYAPNLIEAFVKINVLNPCGDTYWYDKGTLEQFEDYLLEPDDKPETIPYYPGLEKEVFPDWVREGLFY